MRPTIQYSVCGVLMFCLALLACQPDEPQPAPAPQVAQTQTALKASPAQAATEPVPVKPMAGAKRLITDVERLIREQYVDAGLTEDELWTGAIEGMLQRLIQLKGKNVNTLIDPDHLNGLRAGLKGTFYGVGVVLDVVEGIALVREALPGSAAAAAGITGGDRVLAIDGKSVRGLSVAELVRMIRGPEGTRLTMLMQRDSREWNQPLIRRAVKLEAVFAKLLPDKIGYVRITEFNQTTVERLDALLLGLKRDGAQSLVLDLRGCPGGLLDASLQVAERFIPAGKTIVALRRRRGEEEIKRVKSEHPWSHAPMVALVNGNTSSGAEILAGALRGNNRARLVGEPTLGKATVEEILELGNHWALKLSVARFVGPDGSSWQRAGIQPDFTIPGCETCARSYSSNPNVDPVADAQLKAAIAVLKMETRAQP